jgi:hypothetical protein
VSYAFSVRTFLSWTAVGLIIGLVLFFAVSPSAGNGGEPSVLGMFWGIFGIFVMAFGWNPLRQIYCMSGCQLFPGEIARLVLINWVILGVATGVVLGFLKGRKSAPTDDD